VTSNAAASTGNGPGAYQGKVALITGSSRGIGQALALSLARGGASIVINYKKNADLAEKTRADVEQLGGHAITVAAELIPMTAVLLGAPDLGKLISDPAPMQYFVTARGGSGLNTVVSLAIAVAIRWIRPTVAKPLKRSRST